MIVERVADQDLDLAVAVHVGERDAHLIDPDARRRLLDAVTHPQQRTVVREGDELADVPIGLARDRHDLG